MLVHLYPLPELTAKGKDALHQKFLLKKITTALNGGAFGAEGLKAVGLPC
jgi:hypothetical protein